MLTLEIIDRSEFTSPLAGRSPQFLGGAPGETRDLKYNLFITAYPEFTIPIPNVLWTWKQGNVVALEKELLRKHPMQTVAMEVPAGLTSLPYLLFDRLDTQKLADGVYQVTALLRDGTVPLASVTHTLRIDKTDLYLVTPEEVEAAAEKRFFNIERGLLEHREVIKNIEDRVSQLAKQIQAITPKAP